ncbi:putative ferric-chelate reductase 1 isoform X2 [Haliotis rubra]|nr:putative ferric-chelate reductase 1 isoform X2 [Haliotis rubra]
MAVYTLLAIACVLPTLVLGYSAGAGKSACINLTPNHDNTTAQNSTAPYTLTVNTTSIIEGGVVTVTLETTAAGGYFEGFLVQARCTKCTTADTAIVPGTFAKYNASDDTIKTMDCENVAKNAITHTSEAKQNNTMFTWTAPTDYDVKQGIQFRAVIVKSKLTWWNTVMSAEISVSKPTGSSSQSVLGMGVFIVSITASLLL